MAEIRVHIDTLEYTREGLKTREGISLSVGQHNRVVLVRPDRVRPSGDTIAAFGSGSAFPGPPVVATFLSAKAANVIGGWFSSLFGEETVEQEGVFQVFGHCDESGGDEENKDLSERRAEVFTSILVGDVDRFIAAAEAEKWGLQERQTILRVLQCDPGPIDGEDGPLTQAAIRDFQADYVHGFFHAESEDDPRDPELAVDGELGPKTERALLEAFVVATSPRIDESRLHPTHPSAGCATFNRIADERPELNRRVSLVLHRALPPYHDQAPCTKADQAACPFDGRDRSGCLWYREHIAERREADCRHEHYDLRWMLLPNGRVLLSALTTLPDDSDVHFQVFRSKPVASADEAGVDDTEEPLSERVAGVVRKGVAQVVWDPGDLDVFDDELWFEPITWEMTIADPVAAWNADNLLRVPVFRVDGGGAVAVSGPPARQIHQVRLQEGGVASDAKLGWVVDASGNYREVALNNGRADVVASIRRGTRSILGLLIDGAVRRTDGGKK